MNTHAWQWAMGQRAGGTAAKAVLLTLASMADAHGDVTASQSAIAARAECSERQVRRVLTDLEASGLIARERRADAGRTDVITLRVPSPAAGGCT